jgi:hypothetical protein
MSTLMMGLESVPIMFDMNSMGETQEDFIAYTGYASDNG